MQFVSNVHVYVVYCALFMQDILLKTEPRHMASLMALHFPM